MTISKGIDWEVLLKEPTALKPVNTEAVSETRVAFTDQGVSEITIAPPEVALNAEEASKLLPWGEVESFKEQAQGFEVVTIEECKTALSMAMQSRKLAKAVDKKRKEITKPHLDFQKSVKKIADAFIDELKTIEASMTEKVESFNKAREEKSAEIGVELSTVDNVEDGLSYEQEYWEFEVSDLDKVPAKYLKIDDKAVKEALNDGVRNIEGLRVFKTTKKRYRIK